MSSPSSLSLSIKLKSPHLNSNKSTLKSLNQVRKHYNKSKQNIDIFRENFEGNFAKHDETERYNVRRNMLEPYLSNNLELSKNTELWVRLYKKHRYLLYLDQFINFITNEYSTLNSFVDYDKPKDNYYRLPIANSINSVDTDNLDKMLQMYCDRIYNNIAQINNTYILKQPEITGISLICSHGGHRKNPEILIVPDDIVIAFITPLNKFSYQDLEDFNQIVYTLNEYKDNQDFLKNSACYLRNNMCFNNATYYYPGQKILNYELKINISKDFMYSGFYNITSSNKDIPANERQQLFKSEDNINYLTTLQDIFTEKQEIIKNKILFINCCRKCDINFTSKQVEFLYRYEHIITYLNMSRCNLEIKDKTLYKCSFDKSVLNTDVDTIHIKLGKTLFYDSALSYNFKENYTKKSTYMLPSSNSSTSANNLPIPSSNKTLKKRGINTELQKLQAANNYTKYTKISDILRSLIHNLNDHNLNDIDRELFKKNILIVFDYINEYNLDTLYEPIIKLLLEHTNKKYNLLASILFKICLNFNMHYTFDIVLSSKFSTIIERFVFSYKKLFIEYNLDFYMKETIIFTTLMYIFNKSYFVDTENIYLGTSMIQFLWDLHVEILNIQQKTKPIENCASICIKKNGIISYKDKLDNIYEISTQDYYYNLFKYLTNIYISNFENSHFLKYRHQVSVLFDYNIFTISEQNNKFGCKKILFDDIYYEIFKLFDNKKFMFEDMYFNNVIEYFTFPLSIAILGQDVKLIEVLWAIIFKDEKICGKNLNIIASPKYLCLIFYLMIYQGGLYMNFFYNNKLISEIISTLIEKINEVEKDYNMLYVALYKLYIILFADSKISVTTNEVINKICADPNIKIRTTEALDPTTKNYIGQYIEQFINKYNKLIETSSETIDEIFIDKKESTLAFLLLA